MVATAEVLSPVAGVPLLGDLVSLLDGAATQAGIPFWLRASAELVVVALLGYLLLRVLTARLLPWLGTALVPPAALVVQAALVLLLLPDLGISRLSRRFGRTPPEVVYGYGAAVMGCADAAETLLRRGLPKLQLTRLMRPWLLVALLLAGFLLWNGQDCAAGVGAQCVSPVQFWMSSVGSA
ncbi:hypothetical protein OG943_04935 [Amycolatopsis sp. NBC_00345]|uniref:hypothetical protein n=1 Tax=Amycolatopsis sp. NBC_00345 TaxID=2975955 RepID=UPI002E26164C